MRLVVSNCHITGLFLVGKKKSNKSESAFVCCLFVSEFDLRSFLCSESEQLIWKGQGLPSDDLSMENALVILQVRHPFVTRSNFVHFSTFALFPLITIQIFHRKIYCNVDLMQCNPQHPSHSAKLTFFYFYISLQ